MHEFLSWTLPILLIVITVICISASIVSALRSAWKDGSLQADIRWIRRAIAIYFRHYTSKIRS